MKYLVLLATASLAACSPVTALTPTQHDDSKVYCAEHAHVARELDLSWALEQQKRIDKEKLRPLIDECIAPDGFRSAELREETQETA